MCTFDCIYCECGFNDDRRPRQKRPSRQEVAEALEAQLKKMHDEGVHPDVLTFAGNGEPTSHPDFADIIDDTIALRDSYCPEAKVSVLSNSTFILRPDIHSALMRVDNNILKLDTVDPLYINKVDKPTGHYDVNRIIDAMKRFEGHVIIQTMFMKGNYGGESVDDSADSYVSPWLEAVKSIQPMGVRVYTIDRETPAEDLQKATHDELNSIRDRVIAAGIPCTASY